jgi:two-component system response regulator DesR
VPIARTVRPDVILIDLALLTEFTARRLSSALPECAIAVLAGQVLTEATYEALRQYVHAFIGSDAASNQLADYLRRAAAGERVIDPELAIAALSGLRNPLTNQEREILRLAGSGMSTAEISAAVHLSVGTVRNYVSTIMRKTDARTRLEAFRIAVESGWL